MSRNPSHPALGQSRELTHKEQRESVTSRRVNQTDRKRGVAHNSPGRSALIKVDFHNAPEIASAVRQPFHRDTEKQLNEPRHNRLVPVTKLDVERINPAASSHLVVDLVFLAKYPWICGVRLMHWPEIRINSYCTRQCDVEQCDCV